MKFFSRFPRKQALHYLHIGKTGGTAIKEALSTVKRGFQYRLYLHDHATTFRDVPNGDKAFFFVRDPIDRFISGFYSRKRMGRPRYNFPWIPEEREAFATFETANDLASSLSSPNASTKHQAIKAMKNIEHVRDGYRNWFHSKEYLLSRKKDILFIGLTECLEQDFAIFTHAILGIKNIDLPTDLIRSHRNPPEIDRSLNELALVNLKKWYREDYEYFLLFKQMRKEILEKIHNLENLRHH